MSSRKMYTYSYIITIPCHIGTCKTYCRQKIRGAYAYTYKINDLISPFLDVCDPIDGEYFLEVSSPGLERILKKPKHFQLSSGDKIEIKLIDKTKITGILGVSDNEGFYLDSTYYRYSDIKKAKSIFEW